MNLRLYSPCYLTEKDNIKNNNTDLDKKKSFDLSTNASNKLLPTLSNPTNLTNPLIIGQPKRQIKGDFIPNKEYQINKLNAYNKLLFNIEDIKIHTSKSELNLLCKGINGPGNISIKKKIYLNPISPKKSFEISESRNSSLIMNNESKSLCDRKKINISNDAIIKNTNFQENKNLMSKNAAHSKDKEKNNNLEMNTIWEKLKNAKTFKSSEKNKRFDIPNFFKKHQYIDTKNQINLIKHDTKIKNMRLNKIKKYNANDINILDNIMSNLEKSSDYIQKNYQEKYVSDVLQLLRQVEKEKIISNNLLIDKNLLLRQISKIQNNINKVSEEKNSIIKWIFLQIQIKEKTIKLPLYYKDIIENKMSLDCIQKKYRTKEKIIDEKEFNRVKEYRENLIFKSVDELYKIYKNMEKKIFIDLNKKLNNIGEVKKLKNDLISNSIINDNNENDNENKKDKDKELISFEEKEKEFLKLLKKLKFENNELNEEYSKIANFRYLLNDGKRLSFYKSFINEINNNDNMGKKLPLINIAMNLYDEISKVKIGDIPNVFKWKHSLKEERIILDILIYTERVVNFLYEEKKHYFSDKNLKMIYKSVAEEVEKETKNKKLIKQMEIQAKLLIARKEKIQMKLNNKINFKPYKKVDFQYFMKEKFKNKNEQSKKENNDDQFLQYFFY